ncbi:MAG: winged helix-turn-helix domain-containing protein [Methanothrix sp.]|nr:winged helix-turn-helix domain-containing protein [Methanothrix sp.]
MLCKGAFKIWPKVVPGPWSLARIAMVRERPDGRRRIAGGKLHEAGVDGQERRIVMAPKTAGLVAGGTKIERSLHEVALPNITAILEDRQKRILKDISKNQPTTITDIAKRLSVSESTISRQVARLTELGALDAVPRGKTKEVRITLTGKILL